ncbi:hypothetical protein V5799_031372 [Amblyomma americanum]|uniref:Peptidase M13 N-terminal domain-containing protein n=1 Tax=Amblyomma americanum TaxID=6943 RepID=A0AAQ4EKE9_AMBAM
MPGHRKKKGSSHHSRSSHSVTTLPEQSAQPEGQESEATSSRRKKHSRRKPSNATRTEDGAELTTTIKTADGPEPPTAPLQEVTNAPVHESRQAPPPTLLAAVAKFKALKDKQKESEQPSLSKPSSKSSQEPSPSLTSLPSTATGPARLDAGLVRDARRPIPEPEHDALVPPPTNFLQPEAGIGAGPAVVCFAGTIILAFVALLIFKQTLQPGNEERRSVFCCANDMQALAGYVNASIDPCDSFFEYVCSTLVAERNVRSRSTVSYSSALPTRLNPSFELDVLMSVNGTRSEVSTFLRSLFDSCLNADTNESSILDELGSLLVSIAGDHLRDSSPAGAFAYLLLTNIKYGIPSVILAALKGIDAILLAHNQREGCRVADRRFQMCLNFSTTMLYGILKRQTTFHNVIAYASSVETAKQEDAVLKIYERGDATEVLRRWHATAALKAISIGLDNIALLYVSDEHHIEALVTSLDDRKRKDAAAVYLFASSACNALVDLEWTPTPPSQSRTAFCLHQIDLMPNVRNAMYTVEFVTPERSLQVTRVVNFVIEALKLDCLSSAIFSPEDSSLLNTFFASLTLIVPQPLSLSSIQDNHFTQTFLEKLLQGHSSEHETRLALARHRLPFESPHVSGRIYDYIKLQRGDRIIVSPALYSLIRIDPMHSDVFNTPVIAVALAQSIWRFILTKTALWSSAARDHITELVDCFRKHYFTAGKNLQSVDDQVNTVAASLAVSSVLSRLTEPDWYKMERAWRHWSLSHSRFFYMRETFYRCPTSLSAASKENVDVPLMYVEAFSRAFQCQPTDRMSKERACAFPKE